MNATHDLQKMLIDAARRGDVRRLQEALAGGAEVNGALPGTNSAVCQAVMSRRLDCVRLLVEAGADVNHRGSYGRTPLHYGAQQDAGITRYLLDHGADMRARNDGDEDVLEDLITQDGAQVEIARLLIERGFDLSMRPTKYHGGRSHLRWAAFCGRVSIVELLVQSGVDVNENGPALLADLGASCRPEGRTAILRLLVRGGLDPSTRADWHGTVLTMAIQCRDRELVRELLARGADPRQPGDSGSTPLSRAEETGDAELVLLLREHGASSPADARSAAAEDPRLAAARRQVVDRPDDADLRIDHARELARTGFRVAALHESQIAARLGARIPAEIAELATIENPMGPAPDSLRRRNPLGATSRTALLRPQTPDGTLWTILPLEEVGVAKPVEDARWPGARVRCGERELPLVFVLGGFCRGCDEEGTTECSQCHGSGTRYGFFNDEHEYPCAPRETCASCGGTHFVLNTSCAAAGACRHSHKVREAVAPEYVLERCSDCGLAIVSCGGMFADLTACSQCNLFDCRCSR